MTSIARVKAGDLVRCEVRGSTFYAEATSGPIKVSPRVYELSIRPISGASWAKQYPRVRGRQVVQVYRKLQSGTRRPRGDKIEVS